MPRGGCKPWLPRVVPAPPGCQLPRDQGLGRWLQGQRWLEHPRSPGGQGAKEEASLLPGSHEGAARTPTLCCQGLMAFRDSQSTLRGPQGPPSGPRGAEHRGEMILGGSVGEGSRSGGAVPAGQAALEPMGTPGPGRGSQTPSSRTSCLWSQVIRFVGLCHGRPRKLSEMGKVPLDGTAGRPGKAVQASSSNPNTCQEAVHGGGRRRGTF